MELVNSKISSTLLLPATLVAIWIATSCCDRVQAQCPWTHQSQELHADCICDFNLSQTTNLDRHPVNRMSVQCSPVNFERLVDALKQTASIELPQVLLPTSTNTTTSQDGDHNLQLSEAREQLASQAKLDLLHVSNSSIGQLRANSFMVHFQMPINNNQSRYLVVAMQSLHLSRCSINYINQDAFRGLEWSLSSLSLTDNLLEWIPVEALQRLVNLRLLDLTNNRILQVPDRAFQTLTKLGVLRLADNRFGSPNPTKSNSGLHTDSFKGLQSSLMELNLKNVQLSSLPVDALRGLNRLAFLNLAQNQISSLESRSFETLTSLTAINLERNRIARLNDGTFIGVEKSLNSLSLLGNLLEQFPSPQIASLQNLRRLDLGFNGIESIPNDAFRENKQLILVALDGNPLETLPEQAFSHLEGSLRSLSVGGRALNCDCRLSWLIRWQIQHRLLISSRERQPQFCSKPQHFRSLVSFVAIKPENLICTQDSTVKSSSPTTLSYYLYNDTSMRSPTVRLLLPSADEITTTIAPPTTTSEETTTQFTPSEVSQTPDMVNSEYSPTDVNNMVTVKQISNTDLEGTESSLYTTTWQRTGVFGERFTSSKYEDTTLNPTSFTDQHHKLSRQGYLPTVDRQRKTPFRDARNRTQIFDKRRRNQSSIRTTSFIDEIQRMTTKPQAVPVVVSSTPKTLSNGPPNPPYKGARFIDDTPMIMLESINRPERVNVPIPIATGGTTGVQRSIFAQTLTTTTSTTSPPHSTSIAPEVAVQNNTRMSVSSLYRMATSKAPVVVAILDLKSLDTTNSSVSQGLSESNMNILNESPKLFVQNRTSNANNVHQINGTITIIPKDVTKTPETPQVQHQAKLTTPELGLVAPSHAASTSTTSTTSTTTTTTPKPLSSSTRAIATLDSTIPRNIILKPRDMRSDASVTQILGYHIRIPDLDQAALMFAGFLCFIILMMALSMIVCLCCGSPERASGRRASSANQANAITKSTTRLASFSSQSSSTTGAPVTREHGCLRGCLSFCCLVGSTSSNTATRAPITQIKSLIHATEDETNTENSSSRGSNSETDVGHYGTKTMLISNHNEPPKSFMKKSSSGNKLGVGHPVEPLTDFWLSRAPSSCDSDKSFSPGANRNNHYNISQAHRAYLAGHAPVQASLFVSSSNEESSGSSSRSFLKTLKDLYPAPEVAHNNTNKGTGSSSRAPDRSSCSHLRGARATLHQQSGRTFEVGRSLSIGRMPAIVNCIGSELTPMSAEEHWPEPYSESLEQEEGVKQEVGPVYYANEINSNNQLHHLNHNSLKSAHQISSDRTKTTTYQNWLASRRSSRQARNQQQCHEFEYPGSPLSSESSGGGLVRYRSIPSLSQQQPGATNWLRWADDSSLNQPVFETFTSMDPSWCRDNQLESIYVAGSSKRELH